MDTLKVNEILSRFSKAYIRYMKFAAAHQSKKPNRAVDRLYSFANDLGSIGELGNLRALSSSIDLETRMWAAFYILPIDEKLGLQVLDEIGSSKCPFSMESQYTAQARQKGTLKVFRN